MTRHFTRHLISTNLRSRQPSMQRHMLPRIFDSASSPKPGCEYRVFELASEDVETPFLYPHGSPHTDEQAALDDLKRKREVYGKYGRKFTLLVRGISPWREYEPFNPEAE